MNDLESVKIGIVLVAVLGGVFLVVMGLLAWFAIADLCTGLRNLGRRVDDAEEVRSIVQAMGKKLAVVDSTQDDEMARLDALEARVAPPALHHADPSRTVAALGLSQADADTIIALGRMVETALAIRAEGQSS